MTGVQTCALPILDSKALQAIGDAVREAMGNAGAAGVAALGARFDDGKASLLVVATDGARSRGATADALVRTLAATAGGRGGGKPHMAQAGIPDGERLPEALAQLEPAVRALLTV